MLLSMTLKASLFMYFLVLPMAVLLFKHVVIEAIVVLCMLHLVIAYS